MHAWLPACWITFSHFFFLYILYTIGLQNSFIWFLSFLKEKIIFMCNFKFFFFRGTRYTNTCAHWLWTHAYLLYPYSLYVFCTDTGLAMETLNLLAPSSLELNDNSSLLKALSTLPLFKWRLSQGPFYLIILLPLPSPPYPVAPCPLWLNSPSLEL